MTAIAGVIMLIKTIGSFKVALIGIIVYSIILFINVFLCKVWINCQNN